MKHTLLKTITGNPLFIFFNSLLLSTFLLHANPEIITEKNMVVVIPSYNNSRYYKANLDSVLSQKYTNFRAIYIDDCSPDGTGDLVEEYIKHYDTDHRITLIKNSARQGAMANLYHAIHSCDDNDIILSLDGDDWFAHKKVLSKINQYYQNPDIWITYGQSQIYPGYTDGWAEEVPTEILQQNAYRDYRWVTDHLRTFYAWLFKRIQKEDLFYEGDFFAMTYDQAIMFPMLEMSGGRSVFIPDYIYIYNRLNPINDDKVNQGLQVYLEHYIRSKKRYTNLKPIINPIPQKDTNHG
ncbi:MAG: glycosyltransferase [Candidatus Dependentiae bacterium]|nr:glycosyltransferase [Candidatus Dependentiae bacterium]